MTAWSPDGNPPCERGRKVMGGPLQSAARTGVPSHDILGVKVHALNLRAAVREVLRLVQQRTPGYVCVTGVHGVIESQFDRHFRDILNGATLCTPDGMPTVWLGRLKGHRRMGRVYGPDLMAEVCEATRDQQVTHFLYGGGPGVAEQLRQCLESRHPGIRIVGTFTPPFRPLDEDEQSALEARFRELRPDITWVGLSTPKQEKFMACQLGRLDTTLMFGVGAAFDFLSGRVRQAPRWIQHSGFEWLYRVAQEPRRLWRRYLVNNTLFLFWLLVRECPRIPGHLWQRLREGPPAEPCRGGRPLRIAFIGSRGVPARYSGFETVVEQLGARLASRGHEVTVYNRLPYYQDVRKLWKGMELRWLPAIATKHLDSISHTTLSLVDACFRRYDLVYICGVGNMPRARWWKRLLGARLVVNVDGADFKRKKWGRMARWWLRTGERKATVIADAVIADHPHVAARYERVYGHRPVYLGYGAVVRTAPVSTGELDRWGLRSGGYILLVSRLTPENECDLVLQAHARMNHRPPLVVVGSEGYEREYGRQLRSMAAPEVLFTGGRYGAAYEELSHHAAFFVMPATIEATRLVLLDQMAMGKAILYQDCPATREVLGDTGEPFGTGFRVTAAAAQGGCHETCGIHVALEEQPSDLTTALAEKMSALWADPARCRALGAAARERVRTAFSWEPILDAYERLFDEIMASDPGR